MYVSWNERNKEKRKERTTERKRKKERKKERKNKRKKESKKEKKKERERERKNELKRERISPPAPGIEPGTLRCCGRAFIGGMAVSTLSHISFKILPTEQCCSDLQYDCWDCPCRNGLAGDWAQGPPHARGCDSITPQTPDCNYEKVSHSEFVKMIPWFCENAIVSIASSIHNNFGLNSNQQTFAKWSMARLKRNSVIRPWFADPCRAQIEDRASVV